VHEKISGDRIMEIRRRYFGVWATSLIVLTILVLGGCMPYTTGLTEVGVRTVKFGLFRKAGVDPKIYGAASTYWFVPLINDWHTFDTKIQVLEMVFDPGSGDRQGRDDLLFKTIDGNDISLDVIISYRVDPDKAPYILQNVAETDEELRENLVRTIARSVPRDVFGELTTEEFYVSDKRATKAARAKDVLNQILEPYGIIVENVLTKDYRFNPAYQKAIEERKVADQLAEKAIRWSLRPMGLTCKPRSKRMLTTSSRTKWRRRSRQKQRRRPRV
jgi:regulator of protease activity HflC (stomatin/prohibitin superfamily)